jgi:hypothetical protein
VTVTIHTGQNSHDLLSLIRDLQLLDGGGPHRVRRAVHGSGAIVDDELALMWLTLTTAPSPEFLESLIRVDPKLEDLVGRRASDAALRELYLYLNEPAEEEVVLEPGEVVIPADVARRLTVAEEALPEVATAAEHRALPPAQKASAQVWKEWAVAAQILTPDQAETSTKAQIQQLAEEIATSGQSAPEETKEG